MPGNRSNSPDCSKCEKDELIGEIRELSTLVKEGHARAEERHKATSARLKTVESKTDDVGERVSSIEGGLEAMGKFSGALSAAVGGQHGAASSGSGADNDETVGKLIKLVYISVVVMAVISLVLIGVNMEEIRSLVAGT